MVEGDITFFNHIKEQIMIGAIDFSGGSFKCMLLGAGYSLVIDGNLGYADVSAQEISTTGYTAGGKVMAGSTVTQDDANDRAAWDANDVLWTNLSTTVIDHAIVYEDAITTPVADPLVLHVEITTDSNGNNYTIAWHADGIALLT